MDLTDEQIITTLRAVVAERPDYVYERPAHMKPIYGDNGHIAADCLYVHTAPDDATDLTPGCLIGKVFHRLGVSLEDLVRWEGKGGFEVADEYGASTEVGNVLSTAQNSQDSGQSWGVALADATECHPEVMGE